MLKEAFAYKGLNETTGVTDIKRHHAKVSNLCIYQFVVRKLIGGDI